MSAYSIVNLKEEVEDSMVERALGIEGRFARKHLDSEHLGISYLKCVFDSSCLPAPNVADRLPGVL